MSFASKIFGIAIALICACGCASNRAHTASATTLPSELAASSIDRNVEARVSPPRGWIPQPLKLTPRSKHQLWLSPSGRTAYGIIHFNLPIPAGYDLALWGFLNEMRRTEGSATLIEKNWDKNLDGLRFVASGGFHRVEVNYFVSGFHGWAVYAGTQQGQPIEVDELDLARLARENTSVGLPEANRR